MPIGRPVWPLKPLGEIRDSKRINIVFAGDLADLLRQSRENKTLVLQLSGEPQMGEIESWTNNVAVGCKFAPDKLTQQQ